MDQNGMSSDQLGSVCCDIGYITLYEYPGDKIYRKWNVILVS